MAKIIYCINGPNLNLLGKREPEIYGTGSLADIEKLCQNECAKNNVSLDFSQTNIEGELVDKIQEAGENGSALIINAAAYTHTSVAIYDALKMLSIPIIEVHLSQPAARESFRQKSYIAPLSTGSISGFGAQSYILAVKAAINCMKES